MTQQVAEDGLAQEALGFEARSQGMAGDRMAHDADPPISIGGEVLELLEVRRVLAHMQDDIRSGLAARGADLVAQPGLAFVAKVLPPRVGEIAHVNLRHEGHDGTGRMARKALPPPSHPWTCQGCVRVSTVRRAELCQHEASHQAPPS